MADARILVSALSSDRNLKFESTDENGNFRIANLTDGAYRLRPDAPAYVAAESDEAGPEGLPKFYRPGEAANFTLVKGGVITGMVSNQTGEPIVGLNVSAVRIKGTDETDNFADALFGTSRPTDDRGIYRIYGLRAGKYVVYAGKGVAGFSRSSPFDKDSPTYYPSSTRDTALVLAVQTGQELSDINIRYRGDRGFTISGTLTGAVGKNTMLSLTALGSDVPVSGTFSMDQNGRHPFAFDNVSGGDYKIVALSGDDKMEQPSSGSISVSIKNVDVTGIVLNLAPMASISGRVTLAEPTDAKCESKNMSGLEQVVLAMQPEKKQTENPFLRMGNQASADRQGEFRIGSITSGSYRLRALLPSDDWYIQSIIRPGSKSQPSAQAPKPSQSPAELVSINNGESMSGLAINLATGAGSVNGQIKSSNQNALDFSAQRLFLVPTEKERADDTLRYAQVSISSDGSFSFRNLAPGRYFLISRILSGPENPARPLVWDPKERANLLHDAEAFGAAVEIRPCQAINDYKLVVGTNGSIRAVP